MKKLYYFILVALATVVAFVSCEKDDEAMLLTLKVANESYVASYTSAEIVCNISSEATIKYVYLQYSTVQDFEEYKEIEMQGEKGIYQVQLTDLQDNTTYYIRYAASNRFSSIIDEEVYEFQTLAPSIPSIVFDTITTVWDTYAKIQLHLVFDGGAPISEMGVCWNTQTAPVVENNKMTANDTVAALEIKDLQPNTQYFVRAYAINKVGVAYSEEYEFTTFSLPEIKTEDITDMQLTTALLNGTLVFNGNDTATIKGFCWSTNDEPTLDNDHIELDTTSATYAYRLSNLIDETQYYVRAYARNKIGIVYGENKSFTTKSALPPTISTKEVMNVEYHTATITAEVASDGGASVTERGICYSTTENPTTESTKIVSGKGTGNYTVNLTELQDSTTYYVRAYAINKKGIAYGEQMSFMTKGYKLPIITTATPSNVEYHSATIGGNISSDGGSEVTERGICYSTTANPTIENSKIVSGKGTGSYTANLTDLQDSTTYYVRAYAINKKGIAYGEQVSFMTKGYKLPTITTANPTNVEYTSATVGGNVSSDGGAEVTERGICYSTTESPTTESNKIVSGKGTGNYTINLTDLQDSTTYYVRAYAINKKGIAYGEQMLFMTKGYKLPSITTIIATQVTTMSAIVGGNVTADGGLEITERGICYSQLAAPTILDDTIQSGKGIGEFTIELWNLLDNTNYYVRAYAKNSKGIAYGEEISFTTKTKTYVDGYEYVDLGLPSGLKWATMNVGANSPEESGDYFAWGETEPKHFFDMYDYKYAKNENGVWSMIKYGTEFDESGLANVIDNKITLDLSDDAAHVNMGGKWRMPTFNELLELKESCTWMLTKRNGIDGYEVIGPNGNSIFLPISGWYDAFGKGIVNSCGNIHSSSICWNSTFFQEGLAYTKTGIHLGIREGNPMYRGSGLTIRPVHADWESEVLPNIKIYEASLWNEKQINVRGVISDEGSTNITEYGICYDDNSNLSVVSSNKIVLGKGTGSINYTITNANLKMETTYYICIYAVTPRGKLYSKELPVRTSGPYFSTGNGIIEFSPGNLQYHPTNNEWRFAESQLDYIGYANRNTSSDYNDWIDLFGWSTNDTNFGLSTSIDDYSGNFVDWGANRIGNSVPHTWRTLTEQEWYHLLYGRPNAESLLGIAQVNSINGLILLPDNWICPADITFKSGFHNNIGVDYYAAYQFFSTDEWLKLEEAGAVFLPASGYYYNFVYFINEYGYYWSSTDYDSNHAYYLEFHSSSAYSTSDKRYFRHSVRLVKDL